MIFRFVYQGEKELILTGTLFDTEWKARIDCFNLEKGYLVDLKRLGVFLRDTGHKNIVATFRLLSNMAIFYKWLFIKTYSNKPITGNYTLYLCSNKRVAS